MMLEYARPIECLKRHIKTRGYQKKKKLLKRIFASVLGKAVSKINGNS